MATKVGSLIISLALESGAFKSGLSASDKALKASVKRMEALGKSMQGIGRNMSLAVTLPLAALAKSSIAAAMESADALAQVNASLKSMGGAANRTAEQLQALARTEMRASLYDDDEILRKVTASLLTFGKISGAAFDQAQQAAIDLSAKLGTDLQASSISVGKALNNPIKGLVALTRAGVSFTDQQKAQVKAMMAVGDVAGAQKIILGELNKEFGGSAAAAAKANPFARLKHSLDDFKETVGAVLLKVLPPFTDALNGVLDAFNRLSPGAQEAVVKFGLLAAAAGPVLYIFGTAARVMAPFTGALSLIAKEGGLLAASRAGVIGLGAAFGPFLISTAAFAAAGYLIYKNWDSIGPKFQALGEGLGLLTPVVKTASADVAKAFADISTAAVASGSATKEQVDKIAFSLANMSNGAQVDAAALASLEDLIKTLQTLGKITPKEAAKIETGLNKIKAAQKNEQDNTGWKKLGDDLVKLSDAIGKAYNDAEKFNSWATKNFPDPWETLRDEWSKTGQEWAKVGSWISDTASKIYNSVKTWLQDKLGGTMDWVRNKAKAVGDAFYTLYDRVVGHSYIPDMVDGIALHMGRLDAVMVKPALSATARTKQAFEKLGEDVKGIMNTLFPDARDLADLRKQLAALDADIAGGGKASGYKVDQLKEGRQRLIDGADPAQLAQLSLPLADRLRLIPDSLAPVRDAQGMLDQLVSAANDNADKLEPATVRIAKSFKDMADATLQSLQGLAGAIKGGGFLDILGAVINLGLQLGSVGAFGKGVQTKINAIPAHANGTSFAPGGLSLVGERGPELVNLPRGAGVIPNHQLGRGGGVTHYHFSGNLLTPEFWAQINAGDARAAQAGAMGGQARVAFAQSRRVA